MAKQTINIGTTANDGTGDPLRTAFDKVNDNFTELYNDDTGDVNSIIAGDGISVDTATGNVTVTNTITNNNQLTNGAGYVDGSGTANKLPKFTDSDTIGNSIVTDNGTGIGINNSNPTEILEVYKAADNSRFKIQNNAFASWVGNDATGFAIETNLFKPITFKPSGVTAMTLDSSGNVGIGTSSPNGRTEIASSATGDTLALQLSNSAGAGNDSVSIRFRNSTVSTSTSGGSEITGLRDATNNGGSLILKTSSSVGTLTERMRIDSSGNVGIGTASPDSILHILGSAATVTIGDSDASSSSTSTILFKNRDGNANYRDIAKIKGITGGNGGYGHIAFETAFNNSLSERMRIDRDGNVGIGTSSPTTKLHLSDSSDVTLRLQRVGVRELQISSNGGVSAISESLSLSSNTGSIFFNTAGTQRMRIDSSGNVGIGTSSPSACRVQIKGNTNSTSSYFDGLKVTSNNETVYTQYNWNGINGNAGLSFATADVERMRIDSSGNVLIGETSISSFSSPNTLRVKGGIHANRGQFAASGSTTSNIVTLANESKNQTYLLSVRQSGAGSNFATAFVIAYGADASAIRMIQDNTNPALSLDFDTSGLTLRLITGSGYGATTWDWVLTRLG